MAAARITGTAPPRAGGLCECSGPVPQSSPEDSLETALSIAAPASLIPPTVNGAPAQTVGVRVAADLLGRHERTVRRWVTSGALPATRTPGGTISIRVADLNAFGTPGAAEPDATEPTSEPSPAAWTPLTDEQWLDACLAPRGSYSLVRTAGVEPHDVLLFWGILLIADSEYLGQTSWGARRWRIQSESGSTVVVEESSADCVPEPDQGRRWRPTVAVASDAASELRPYGFKVRGDLATAPNGDVVRLVVTSGSPGIIAWDLVEVGA